MWSSLIDTLFSLSILKRYDPIHNLNIKQKNPFNGQQASISCFPKPLLKNSSCFGQRFGLEIPRNATGMRLSRQPYSLLGQLWHIQHKFGPNFLTHLYYRIILMDDLLVKSAVIKLCYILVEQSIRIFRIEARLNVLLYWWW